MAYPTPRTRTRSNPPSLLSSTALERVGPADLSLSIVYRSPNELKAAPRKLRRHHKRQLEHLVPGIKKFGIVVPILTDANSEIIDGHILLEAAKALGLERVPTIELRHLTPEQKRALRIALHKIQSMSSWDDIVLKEELQFLSDFDVDLVTFTGFSSAELDVVLNTPGKPTGDDPDDVLPGLSQQAVSRLGDIWRFKKGHRLGCFNALEESSYKALLGEELANLAICEAPYNVPVGGHVTRRPDAREFPMASGDMTQAEFTEFLSTSFRHLAKYSADGSLSLQFMDFRHMEEMLAAGKPVYGPLLNLCVWTKTNAGMGSLWRSQHELCFVWKSGTAAHVNNVELGRHGRNRSNVWPYPGANTGGRALDAEAGEHVTPKNVAMIQDAILDVSRPGEVVLDVFGGSCTTLVAAHRAKRRGYAMELDPLYVDLGVRRMERRTGAEARHAVTGKTFAEMAAERGVALRPRVRTR